MVLPSKLETALFQHPKPSMKTKLSGFLALACMITAFSCKPKTIETSRSQQNANSAPTDKRALSEYKVSDAATNLETIVDTAERLDVIDSDSPSFKKLDKELMDALALISPPKNREEDNVISALSLKTLERKKELLFSIPITPQVQRDCEETWKTLEISNASGFFNDNQNRHVRALIFKYSQAPQLERLVVWRLVRLRMESKEKRGSGTTEDILNVDIAKFLLSALGIDKHELFEATNLKTRSLSEEAGKKGNQAEEEIIRIYSEQSEKAETILENHFKQSP